MFNIFVLEIFENDLLAARPKVDKVPNKNFLLSIIQPD
ncbi:MAG: hypothetical protein CH6_2347 [Candidatus Kapaibacterium sp.]|nr:MAG: hypothetical protein CH6_2347 [Candidatus Kapabacteria bacterium]